MTCSKRSAYLQAALSIRFAGSNFGIEVQIKQRRMLDGSDERSQKFFAQPFAADHIQIFVAYSHCGHRHQRQRRPSCVSSFIRNERVLPNLPSASPIPFCSQTARTIPRRNDRTIRPHKIEEVQLMRLCYPPRVVHVHGNVRVRPAQVYRHSHRRLRVRDSLHAIQNVMPLADRTLSGIATRERPCAPDLTRRKRGA